MATLRRVVRDAAGHTLEFVHELSIATTDFTHGDQLTRTNIGPGRPGMPALTSVSAFTTSADGVVYRNLRIGPGTVEIRHNVRFENCLLFGSPTQTGYTVKHIASAGKLVQFVDCRIVGRSPTTKAATMYGAGGFYATRTIIDGGTDNLFVKPEAGTYPEGFAVVLRHCMFGRLQRSSGAHCDNIQLDSNGSSNGGMLIDRCRIDSLCVPDGSDPLTVEHLATYRGGTGVILTGTGGIKNVRIRKTRATGGNYTLQLQGNGATPTEVTGCTFGLQHQYGPLLTNSDCIKSANTWAETGTTACCGQVTRGQPL